MPVAATAPASKHTFYLPGPKISLPPVLGWLTTWLAAFKIELSPVYADDPGFSYAQFHNQLDLEQFWLSSQTLHALLFWVSQRRTPELFQVIGPVLPDIKSTHLSASGFDHECERMGGCWPSTVTELQTVAIVILPTLDNFLWDPSLLFIAWAGNLHWPIKTHT